MEVPNVSIFKSWGSAGSEPKVNLSFSCPVASMVQQAAKVAVASVVVAALCLMTVPQARAEERQDRCRYNLGAGERQTISSSLPGSGRPSGRDVFKSSSRRFG